MNRYQREVEEMDRRFDARVRVATVAGIAAVVAAAFWGAGFPSVQWIQDFYAERTESNRNGGVSDGDIKTERALEAAASTELGTAGTDSSMSTRPLLLRLMATAPGRHAEEGTAKLGVSEQNPQTYSAGAVLANGARLAAIYADRVILERDGESVTLHLEGEGESPGAAQRELLSVGASQELAAARPTTRSVLTDYLRPSPVFDGETLVGYQVFPGRSSGVFSQMGLQSGDVITGFDGAPLVDGEQAMLLFQYIAEGGVALASVSRKNTRLTLSLDGALILADQERAKQVIVNHMPLGMP